MGDMTLPRLSLRGASAAAAGRLRHAGLTTPELDARLLLCHAAGLSHEAYVALLETELTAEAAKRFGAAIARRLQGEPVSRILGVREFYGRVFAIDAATLDPRPDTETLVEAAFAIIEQRGGCEAPLKLLDLGTGSGCILLTLLAELPAASGVGIDVSAAALACAKANAERLGVERRASFVASDWLQAVTGRFDLIVANPPYLAGSEIAGLAREVSGYEPRAALDGGIDGLQAYRRFVPRARENLRRGGTLLLEIGSDQAGPVIELMAAAGLRMEGQTLWRDLGGRPRVIAASA
jgi:release factor glutamine methyltransferase